MAIQTLRTSSSLGAGFGILAFAWIALLLGGCASSPDLSGLENDELYLTRGEEFVTDAQYLAFALEQSGYTEERGADDYYDPDRGYASEMSPGYRPSFMGPNGSNMQWGLGLSNYFSPYGSMGMGCSPFGQSGYGYDPYGMGGFGNSGFGYNPYGGYGGYGYNPYGGYGGYGSYGYNPYNNYGNNSTGGYTNSDSYDGQVTNFTYTPIMTSTFVNSSYDENGILVRPRTEEVDSETTHSFKPEAATPESAPRGMNRWLESASTPLETESTRTLQNTLNRPVDVSNSERRIETPTRSNRSSSGGSPEPSISTPRNASSPSTRPSGSNRNSSGSSTRSKRGGGLR